MCVEQLQERNALLDSGDDNERCLRMEQVKETGAGGI
jgi:hypothetical protein